MRIIFYYAIAFVPTAMGIAINSLIGPPLQAWISVGSACVSLSLITYVTTGWYYDYALWGKRIPEVLGDLISHMADDDSPAWPHILAGVIGCFGTCCFSAAVFHHIAFSLSAEAQNGFAGTIASFGFGVLVSGISFWTLWQTKRIEHSYGMHIDGFQHLIKIVTVAIRQLVDDIRSNEFHPRSHHRFLLITTNPYLGSLSFPGSPTTSEFRLAMLALAEARNICQCRSGESIDLRIICGTNDALSEFHSKHFGASPSKSTSNSNNVTTANGVARAFIDEISNGAGQSFRGILPVDAIPSVQFIVIGNRVFEFILDASGCPSEIHHARQIAERIHCDRFVETFDWLWEFMNGCSISWSGSSGSCP